MLFRSFVGLQFFIIIYLSWEHLILKNELNEISYRINSMEDNKHKLNEDECINFQQLAILKSDFDKNIEKLQNELNLNTQNLINKLEIINMTFNTKLQNELNINSQNLMDKVEMVNMTFNAKLYKMNETINKLDNQNNKENISNEQLSILQHKLDINIQNLSNKFTSINKTFNKNIFEINKRITVQLTNNCTSNNLIDDKIDEEPIIKKSMYDYVKITAIAIFKIASVVFWFLVS